MDLRYNYLGEKYIETKANNYLYLITIVLNIILIAVTLIILFMYSFFTEMFVITQGLSLPYLISLVILNFVCIAISILLFDVKIEIFSNGFVINTLIKKRTILYEDIESYRVKYPIFAYGFVLKIYLKNNKKISLHESNFEDLKILLFKLVDRIS